MYPSDLLSRIIKFSVKHYSVVQLSLTPEIEVFDMLFDRSLTIFSMTSFKQHNTSISVVKSILFSNHVSIALTYDGAGLGGEVTKKYKAPQKNGL